MRTYFSSYHLWAAKHFARLAEQIEASHAGPPRFDISHRAYVTSGVLSAVAFLEAAINELFDDVADRHPGYVDTLTIEAVRLLAGLWDERETRTVERWPVLEKFRVALLCCGSIPFDKGAQPYQDAKLLIDLRNDLTHARPETRNTGDVDRLSAALMKRFQPNHLMDNAANPYFPDHCLGAGCAAWAVDTARGFADDFFSRVKMQPNYQRVAFGHA
jgi:hypothetical protein